MEPPRLRPRHGPQDPITFTPVQPAGSVRRTTTVDLARPEGSSGPVVIDGRGRDLLVSPAREPHTVGVSRVRGRIDYSNGCRLLEIETAPQDDGVQDLLGATVTGGFRAKVAGSLPLQVGERTLLHLLLDDLPGTVLVSGYALHAGTGAYDLNSEPEMRTAFIAGRANLCAGFDENATMLTELSRTGFLPMPSGPRAPSLTSPHDPGAWHEHPALPAGGIRRRRRTDVVAEGGLLRVDAMFRDSHMHPTDGETIIHEYALEAVVDRQELRVLSIEATPHVLPWLECPMAARSANALVGQTVHELRTWVRATLQGTSTCTHLNDLLRSLADIDRLALPLTDGTD